MSETTSLAHALAVLQTRLPKVEKANTADVPTKAGGRYTYSYADLAQITRVLMPILGELGLSFSTRPTLVDGQFVLAYKLLHVSGESEDGQYPLPTSGTPQAMGSAITYARRYCLCAVTGVAPEDDDDGAAAEAEAKASAARPTQPKKEEKPQTDPAWLERMEQELDAAGSLQELETVASTILAADRAGQVSYVHGQHLHHLYTTRKAALEAEGEQ